MTTTTRRYTVWGLKGDAKAMTSGTVRYAAGDDAIDALTRRIARLTRCSVITARSDGEEMEHGEVVSSHYEITIGHPIPRKRGGGYSVEGSLWAAIYRE